jgi:heme/copper-type cytochrome/quinol oxidase subunit 4
MDSRTHGILLGLAAFFVVIFAGMTFVALDTATLNAASIVAFGFAFFIIAVVLIGLIGAIGNPPDDE